MAFEQTPGVRKMRFCGSWYSSDANKLSRQLDGWLEESLRSTISPKNLVKAIIAPHAGYMHSGGTAAYAYAGLEQSKDNIKTIFLLGPSHRYRFKKCGIPRADLQKYETPFGLINLNLDILRKFSADTRVFEHLEISADEAEHSLEMHLPYISHIMQNRPFSLVPLMFGHLSDEMVECVGSVLSPYFYDKNTFFIVSSDFCHWGKRFQYTDYDPKYGNVNEYVQMLDQLGMDSIESGDPAFFNNYLLETDNTICGKIPISVLLQIISCSPVAYKIKFIKYDQSSKAVNLHESLVGYAAGIIEIARS